MKKKFTIFCLIFIIFLSLGCNFKKIFSDDKQNKKTIYSLRLGEIEHSIFFVPHYIAINKGFFQEEGLNISLTTSWDKDKLITALLSDETDIALIGPEACLYAMKQDKDKELINFAQLTQRNGSFLISRKPIENFNWNVTKNKIIIGNTPGGTPEIILEHILRFNKIRPQTDVNIIQNLSPSNVIGAFQAGVGDFALVMEPTVSLLEKDKTAYVVCSLAQDAGPLVFTGYVAEKNYLVNNQELIQRFTNALYKTQIWLYTHDPKDIVEAIKPSFPDIDKEILLSAIKRYLQDNVWAPTPIIQRSGINRLQDMLIESKEFDKKVPFETFVNNDFANKSVEFIQDDQQ